MSFEAEKNVEDCAVYAQSLSRESTAENDEKVPDNGSLKCSNIYPAKDAYAKMVGQAHIMLSEGYVQSKEDIDEFLPCGNTIKKNLLPSIAENNIDYAVSGMITPPEVLNEFITPDNSPKNACKTALALTAFSPGKPAINDISDKVGTHDIAAVNLEPLKMSTFTVSGIEPHDNVDAQMMEGSVTNSSSKLPALLSSNPLLSSIRSPPLNFNISESYSVGPTVSQETQEDIFCSDLQSATNSCPSPKNSGQQVAVSLAILPNNPAIEIAHEGNLPMDAFSEEALEEETLEEEALEEEALAEEALAEEALAEEALEEEALAEEALAEEALAEEALHKSTYHGKNFPEDSIREGTPLGDILYAEPSYEEFSAENSTKGLFYETAILSEGQTSKPSILRKTQVALPSEGSNNTETNFLMENYFDLTSSLIPHQAPITHILPSNCGSATKFDLQADNLKPSASNSKRRKRNISDNDLSLTHASSNDLEERYMKKSKGNKVNTLSITTVAANVLGDIASSQNTQRIDVPHKPTKKSTYGNAAAAVLDSQPGQQCGKEEESLIHFCFRDLDGYSQGKKEDGVFARNKGKEADEKESQTYENQPISDLVTRLSDGASFSPKAAKAADCHKNYFVHTSLEGVDQIYCTTSENAEELEDAALEPGYQKGTQLCFMAIKTGGVTDEDSLMTTASRDETSAPSPGADISIKSCSFEDEEDAACLAAVVPSQEEEEKDLQVSDSHHNGEPISWCWKAEPETSCQRKIEGFSQHDTCFAPNSCNENVYGSSFGVPNLYTLTIDDVDLNQTITSSRYVIRDVSQWSPHMLMHGELRDLRNLSKTLLSLPRTVETGIHFNRNRPSWAVTYWEGGTRKYRHFFVPDLSMETVQMVLKAALKLRKRIQKDKHSQCRLPPPTSGGYGVLNGDYSEVEGSQEGCGGIYPEAAAIKSFETIEEKGYDSTTGDLSQDGVRLYDGDHLKKSLNSSSYTQFNHLYSKDKDSDLYAADKSMSTKFHDKCYSHGTSEGGNVAVSGKHRGHAYMGGGGGNLQSQKNSLRVLLYNSCSETSSGGLMQTQCAENQNLHCGGVVRMQDRNGTGVTCTSVPFHHHKGKQTSRNQLSGRSQTSVSRLRVAEDEFIPSKKYSPSGTPNTGGIGAFSSTGTQPPSTFSMLTRNQTAYHMGTRSASGMQNALPTPAGSSGYGNSAFYMDQSQSPTPSYTRGSFSGSTLSSQAAHQAHNLCGMQAENAIASEAGYFTSSLPSHEVSANSSHQHHQNYHLNQNYVGVTTRRMNNYQKEKADSRFNWNHESNSDLVCMWKQAVLGNSIGAHTEQHAGSKTASLSGNSNYYQQFSSDGREECGVGCNQQIAAGSTSLADHGNVLDCESNRLDILAESDAVRHNSCTSYAEASLPSTVSGKLRNLHQQRTPLKRKQQEKGVNSLNAASLPAIHAGCGRYAKKAFGNSPYNRVKSEEECFITGKGGNNPPVSCRETNENGLPFFSHPLKQKRQRHHNVRRSGGIDAEKCATSNYCPSGAGGHLENDIESVRCFFGEGDIQAFGYSKISKADEESHGANEQGLERMNQFSDKRIHSTPISSFSAVAEQPFGDSFVVNPKLIINEDGTFYEAENEKTNCSKNIMRTQRRILGYNHRKRCYKSKYKDGKVKGALLKHEDDAPNISFNYNEGEESFNGIKSTREEASAASATNSGVCDTGIFMYSLPTSPESMGNGGANIHNVNSSTPGKDKFYNDCCSELIDVKAQSNEISYVQSNSSQDAFVGESQNHGRGKAYLRYKQWERQNRLFKHNQYQKEIERDRTGFRQTLSENASSCTAGNEYSSKLLTLHQLQICEDALAKENGKNSDIYCRPHRRYNGHEVDNEDEINMGTVDGDVEDEDKSIGGGKRMGRRLGSGEKSWGIGKTIESKPSHGFCSYIKRYFDASGISLLKIINPEGCENEESNQFSSEARECYFGSEFLPSIVEGISSTEKNLSQNDSFIDDSIIYPERPLDSENSGYNIQSKSFDDQILNKDSRPNSPSQFDEKKSGISWDSEAIAWKAEWCVFGLWRNQFFACEDDCPSSMALGHDACLEFFRGLKIIATELLKCLVNQRDPEWYVNALIDPGDYPFYATTGLLDFQSKNSPLHSQDVHSSCVKNIMQ